MPTVSFLHRARDGLSNLVSGLGTGAAKGTAGIYTPNIVTQNDVEAAYSGGPWFRKIVDIPAFDMTREWRDWQADGPQIEAIEALEKQHRIRRKVRQAIQWARLYGGAALVLGIGNDDPSQPLDVERVGKGALAFAHVLHRYQLSPGQLDEDPISPWFGGPSYFELNRSSSVGQSVVRVHPSRLIRVNGNDLPPNSAMQPDNGGWGQSIYVAVQQAVKDADVSTAVIAELLQEAKVDTIRVPGFMEGLATAEYEARFMRRFSLAKLMQSITNTKLLDKEEEWESRQVNFAGLPEVVKILILVMAGAADIPATRLLGQSPQGMNATGDSDTRNYYDMLRSRQNDLADDLTVLDEVLIRSAVGSRPDEIHYEWAPLWTPTPSEKADIDKKNAEMVQIYANTGLIPNDALATATQNKLVEDAVFPGIEAALEESNGELAIEAIEEDPAEVEGGGAEVVPLRRGSPVRTATGDSRTRSRARTRDSAPRTLYMRRDLKNAAEFRAWAKAQGFKSTVDDPHVTVAFSREPVDWMKVGEDWMGGASGELVVGPGGPRLVEALGAEGAIVLMFSSTSLAYRHMSMRESGASWDYPEYQPHVTITYEPNGIDLSKVEPYRGELVFGPEIFEEINPSPDITEG